MKKPEHPKERNLIKGAIRRVFSRSDLRRQCIDASLVAGHIDPARPRVTKWSKCSECQQLIPKYLMECDHIDPLVPLHKSLEDLSWDEVVERTWCDLSNLRAICKSCHRAKSTIENKERRRLKKDKNEKQKA